MENHPAMVLAEMLKHNLKIFFSFKNNVFRKGRFAPSNKNNENQQDLLTHLNNEADTGLTLH